MRWLGRETRNNLMSISGMGWTNDTDSCLEGAGQALRMRGQSSGCECGDGSPMYLQAETVTKLLIWDSTSTKKSVCAFRKVVWPGTEGQILHNSTYTKHLEELNS